MVKILKQYKTDDYVFDISLDGTIVNALGLNVARQTDGMNMKMPDTFRYTEENPYIGKGLNREVVKGKKYIGVYGDVAEFSDLFLRGRMGLGVDEFCPATINYSRKNYSDRLEDGSIKLVGNTVKSRRLANYISKFLDVAIPLLLDGKGQEFIEYYNDYISKIYNYQIPLRDIAAKGKIKKTLAEYKEDCKKVTKAGNKKSRQVWYELVINANMNVNLDDTIYYINTGTKKSENDCKRVTHQFVMWDGERTELTAQIKRQILTKVCEEKNIILKGMKEKQKKELLAPFIIDEEDEIIVNCKLVPQEIIDSEDDIMCNAEIEYNVVKYIDQFNSRIKPLLVCFHPDIRDRIMIKNPEDKQYFTEAECELVSGYPNREIDQDTYEQLMTPERKEMEFWTKIDKEPPFVEECGIDWEKMVKDFKELKEREKNELFQELNEKYLNILSNLTEEDIEEFEEEYNLPKGIDELMTLNASDMCLYFKDIPDMKPTTGGYIFEDIKLQEKEDLSIDDKGNE